MSKAIVRKQVSDMDQQAKTEQAKQTEAYINGLENCINSLKRLQAGIHCFCGPELDRDEIRVSRNFFTRQINAETIPWIGQIIKSDTSLHGMDGSIGLAIEMLRGCSKMCLNMLALGVSPRMIGQSIMDGGRYVPTYGNENVPVETRCPVILDDDSDDMLR